LNFKGGEKKNPRNYRAIMINSLFAKLMGGTLEKNLANGKRIGKRAHSQASIKAKHSTIKHFLTLRHMVERTWDSKSDR
jgi:hypothetical protein